MGYLEERDLSDVPTIPQYFAGKSVFITGGSGFIGKVLIEKLLYSCADLNRVYILLREKKGVKCQERLEQIYSLPDIIPWRDSRRLLYWRLRRLLRQNEQECRVQAAVKPADKMDQGAAAATLRRWFTEDQGETQSHLWEHDNEAVCKWLEAQAGDESSVLESNLRSIGQDAILQAVNNLVMELTPSQRLEFVRKLSTLEMEQP